MGPNRIDRTSGPGDGARGSLARARYAKERAEMALTTKGDKQRLKTIMRGAKEENGASPSC